MGKFFKWCFIVIASLVVIAAISLVIFVKTFDANRYRDRITSLLSEQIDHPLQVDSLTLDVSFDKGLSLGLDNLVINNKAPSAGEMISIRKMTLGVDLRAFVSSREVVVTTVSVKEPIVHIIKEADQPSNVEALMQLKGSRPAKRKQEDRQGVPSSKKDDLDTARIQINSVDINSGELIIEHRDQESTKKIVVGNIDISVDDFSFENPFPFAFACRLFSGQQNISMRGKLLVANEASLIVFQDTVARAALEDIDLGKFKVFMGKENLPIENIKGTLSANIEKLKIADNTLADYMFDLRLSNGQVSLDQLDHPIENIDIYVLGKTPDIHLKQIFMYIGAGKIDGKGQINNFLTDNDFQLTLDLEGIRMEEIIDQSKSPYKLVGKLIGHASFLGSHNSLGTFQNTLDGKADLTLQEARITGINILKTVMKKLSVIPGFTERMNEELAQRYKEALAQEDTVIDVASVVSNIKEDQIFIKDIAVEAQGFQISARGKVDLEQSVYLEADLYLAADLSRALLTSQELSFLLQEDGRLHVPFKSYRGPLKQIKMFPDIENISRKAIQSRGKQELKKAIFKALDLEEVKKDPSEESAPRENGSPDAQGDQGPAPESSPEEILIENVLDAIFK